jgi:hypothetical protein
MIYLSVWLLSANKSRGAFPGAERPRRLESGGFSVVGCATLSHVILHLATWGGVRKLIGEFFGGLVLGWFGRMSA